MTPSSAPAEWPLNLVVLAPFGPAHGTCAESQDFFEVNKDCFDEVLRRMAVRLMLDIAPGAAWGEAEQWVEVPVESLRSFQPDAIVQSVPQLRELAELRRSAVAGACSWTELQDRLRALGWPAAPPEGLPAVPRVERDTKGADALGSLLSMVDLPAAGAPREQPDDSSTDRLIGQVSAGTRGGGTGPAAAARVVGEIDRYLSTYVSVILRHPEFRRIEALWRGLKFLVERTDFRAPIRILVGSSDKEHLAERVRRFSDEHGPTAGMEGDLVFVAACEFERSPIDVAVLRSLALAGEDVGAPVVAGASAAFLGRASAGIERSTNLAAIFDEPVYAEWRALRAAEESRWLTLVFNAFLARGRYGQGGITTRSFTCDELEHAGEQGGALLWANPVWLLCERLTHWFAASGWPFDVTGRRTGQVDDLPVRAVGDGGPTTFESPLAWLLSRQHVEDLAQGGLAAFTATPNTDAAVLLGIPTAHCPERYSDSQETRLAVWRATFPFQVFAARMSSLAGLVARSVPGGLPRATVIEVFQDAFQLMVPSADAVRIEVAPAAETSERYQVSLTISPERAGLPLPPVHLQCSVRR